LLYERTGLSLDKQAVIERARRQASEARVQMSELIRDPYVLEFVGLAEKPRYTESDLETALLDHIQGFLLELGGGFRRRAVRKSHVNVRHLNSPTDMRSEAQRLSQGYFQNIPFIGTL
jgi:predicted nuclease of restriction endonuclease-like (RecB) superfamily